MIFNPPSWAPQLPFDPPDSIPISEFLVSNESYGRHPLADSKPPFTCGLTGKSYSTLQVKERIESLASSLGSRLGWQPNIGSEWDKVIGIFSLNSIDNMTVSWATHRLSGISAPISAQSSLSELKHQLKSTKSKALFTCAPLLDLALQAASEVGIPRSYVFLVEIPPESSKGAIVPPEFKTVDQLIEESKSVAPIEPLRWEKGRGAKQTAYLCSSSGTSGIPKSVIVTHRNVIANVMQMNTYEAPHRGNEREVCLGLLPQSHSFCLLLISHTSVYRGDGVVVFQGFDLQQLLQAIQDTRMTRLYLVPPMVIAMLKAPNILAKYDLSSVTTVWIGAAPLTEETANQLRTLQPNWTILQGYGLTETSVVVTSTSTSDIWFGSCGSLLPGFSARLLSPTTNTFITTPNTPGELLLSSPTLVPGYLSNPSADAELYHSPGWLRTGDLALFQKSANGHDHLFIVDRIKELIKVRGMQVAPAELEAFLCLHPGIKDAAVVPVKDYVAGELPYAFLVRSEKGVEIGEAELRLDIEAYMKGEKAHYKALKGGVEFVDELPKTVSGKILRKVLKERLRVRGEQAQIERERVSEKENGKLIDGEEIFLDEKAVMQKISVVQIFDFSDDEDGDDDDEEE